MVDRNPESPQLDYAPPPTGKTSGMAVASMVLGLVATPLDYACEFGVLVGLVACILGAISLRRINRDGLRGKAFALVGIIMGSVAMLVGITCGILLTNNL